MVCTWLWFVAIIQFGIASGSNLDPNASETNLNSDVILEMDDRSVSYVKGTANKNSCPTSSTLISTEDDCKLAAKYFGGTYISKYSYSSYPKGCWALTSSPNNFRFNTHSTGKAASNAFTVCEKGGWTLCATITTSLSTSNYRQLLNCPQTPGKTWRIEDTKTVCAQTKTGWVDWEYPSDHAQKTLGYYLDTHKYSGWITPATTSDLYGCGIKSSTSWKDTTSVQAYRSTGTIKVYYKGSGPPATTTTMTTTTATTTTMATTTAGPDNCMSDVGFVVDASGSVGVHYPDEKKFLKKLADTMNISSSAVQVSVVIFSSEKKGHHLDAELKIKFSDQTNIADFKKGVDSLPYWGGNTRIEKGLQEAYEEMFHVSNGMRPSATKTLVLITDGQQSGVDYAGWKHLLQDAGIKPVVVGVGLDGSVDTINTADLLAMVKDRSDLHLVSHFDDLLNDTFIDSVNLCGDPRKDSWIPVTCSQWFNTDNPCTDGSTVGGTDWETISQNTGIFPSAIHCPTSYLIQANVNGTILKTSADALSYTGDRVLFNYKYPPADLTGAGLICDSRPNTWANNGAAQTCQDYSVRFCCYGEKTTKPSRRSV